MTHHTITFASTGTPQISDEHRAYITHCAHILEEGTGPGSDMRGWITVPHAYDVDEDARLRARAVHIRETADTLIVIGIGGSYLGARAVIEAVNGPFGHEAAGGMRILYAGHHLSAPYLDELCALISERNVHLNVISKSGTTLEPAIAFRVLRDALIARYGAGDLIDRITVTTDAHTGALKTLADEEEYETFVVPDDIGGRYSVLTPVGLLPIAVAGIDIDAIRRGADHMHALRQETSDTNPMLHYAAVRSALYDRETKIEALVTYDPALGYIAEWWKQLFGESEGKQGKGLFPASFQFTTDLHSMGQYVQEGERHLCETTIVIADEGSDSAVPASDAAHDGLKPLVGVPITAIQEAARTGVHDAHLSGGVPQMQITIPDRSAESIGMLLYFFEYACAVSAYALGVNPFDQPGVEAYKKNMNDNLSRIGQRGH